MRAVFFALSLLPLPALADTFTLPSQATEAILYAQSGALITHEVAVTAPAGSHVLRLPDLPAGIDPQSLRVSAPGLRIGAVTYREDATPPRPDPERPEVKAARARIDDIEDRMQAVRDDAARTALTIDAANAQIAFLTALGQNDSLPADVATLRDLSQMVRSETLAARQTALNAEIEARAQKKALETLQKDLDAARAALAALLPEPETRPLLTIEVTAVNALDAAPLRVSFVHYSAAWEPSYTMRLTEGETPRLTIERGALVAQNTGENWRGISLTLSTQSPTGQINPSELWPDKRVLYDPDEIRPQVTLRNLAADSLAAEPELMESEGAMTPGVQGLSLVYSYARPIDLASSADTARLPFDELEFDAEIVARAVPFLDDTAYLVARFTNTSGEPLLPIDTNRFFDEGYVGSAPIPMIPSGESTEIGFGPIEGFVLSRTVLQRASGDRGIINRANESTENVRIDLRNLTDRTWAVELIDRVPYSEQEDLEITYTTSPDPDIRSRNDQRGLLQWNLTMAPGSEQNVSTRYLMRWPDGKVVR